MDSIGGSTDRRTNGLTRRRRSSGWPTMCRCRASMYTTTSGSSGSLVLLQPIGDLLASPVMVVVQVQDDGIERQPLLAADGAAPPHVFETVEQPVQARAERRHFFRQRV